MLPRHIFISELIQTQNFQMAITQSFSKSNVMTKSVNIENCLASSKMPKNQNKSWEDLKKYI